MNNKPRKIVKTLTKKEEEEESILIERVERYEQLLNNTFTGFSFVLYIPSKFNQCIEK